MKKLLFVLAIGAFAACGSGTGSGTATDSTKADSNTMSAPADTTHKDTTPMAMDTTHKDTTKKKK